MNAYEDAIFYRRQDFDEVDHQQARMDAFWQLSDEDWAAEERHWAERERENATTERTTP